MADNFKMVKGNGHDGKSDDKKRGKRWTDTEVFTLCQFVQMHHGRLFGSASGHGVAHMRKKAWEEAATAVNEAGDGERGDGKDLRMKWNDLAYRAKKYRTARMGKETGGGPQEPENAHYEAVLQVLPSEAVDGIVKANKCETAPTPAVCQIIPIPELKLKNCSVVVEDSPTCRTFPTDTESESQQSQSQGEKRKTKGKSIQGKKRKASKHIKGSKEVELLQLNKSVLILEEKKLKLKEEKIKLQIKQLDVLERINANIERLVQVKSMAIPMDIFNTMQVQSEL